MKATGDFSLGFEDGLVTGRTDAGLAKMGLPAMGVEVTPLTASDVVDLISSKETSKAGPRFLLNHNLHSVYLYGTDERMRALYERADVILIDGFPLLKYLNMRLRRSGQPSYPRRYRVGSTDWLQELQRRDLNLRIFVLGASPSSNAGCVQTLSTSMSNSVVGGEHGFGLEDVDRIAAAVSRIRAFKPDLLLLGLGMPRQEHFISDVLSRLPDCWIATVGGAIDQISGEQLLAPRRLGEFGLEWLWRLATNPRRLAFRYVIEPLVLAGRLRHQTCRRSGFRGRRRRPRSRGA